MNKIRISSRKEAFFGMHLDLHPTENDVALGADICETNITKLIDRVKPEHIAYDCKGHPGYTGYVGKVGPYAPGIINDSLAMWRKVTKQKGVLLGIHYSGVWDFSAVKLHPEWARINEDGIPDKESTSVFGNYVDELLIPQLEEIIDTYDVDSVWLDGECWGTKLDYCDEAIRQWKEETGYADVPRSKKDAHWSEWKSFNRRAFEKYLCHWTDTIHKYNQKVDVASNWAYTTMMPKDIVANIDFISGDFDPILSVDRARTETRYLNNVGLPWDLQSWGFDLNEEGEESQKLPDHMKQEASIVLMHGGGYMVYFLPTRSGYINDSIIDTAGEVADFCYERKKLCFKSTSVPQIALLYSTDTQLDISDNVYTWWDARLNDLEGALHALLELHYSVDILNEKMLVNRIEEFAMLVIPDCEVLSPEFIGIVLKYVENGGKLMLLGHKCARYFQHQLGINYVGEPHKVKATLNTLKGKALAFDQWQDVEVHSGKILAYRYNGYGAQNRSAYIDTREKGVSQEHLINVCKIPAASMADYGKGQIAAVYGAIPNIYFNNHHPYMRLFIEDMIKNIFNDKLVETNAPSCVDLAIRKSAAGNLCVHFANLSNMPVSKKRAYAEYIPSIYDIKTEIKLSTAPRKVTWEPYGQELSCSFDNNKLTVTVPELHIHGALVVHQ